MRKIYVVLIIALMLGSTLVAAGFLDKITGAWSFSSWFKPKILNPICTVTPDAVKANYYYMSTGQCALVDGKTVKLIDVGSTSVVVDVDGTSKIIPALSNNGVAVKVVVNGIAVKIISVNSGASSAVLSLDEGDSETETCYDGKMNGDEEGIDCGGVCDACSAGSETCNLDGTCQSKAGETSDNCADCKTYQQQWTGMMCSSYKFTNQVDVDKTGYQNCLAKGKQNICMIFRNIDKRFYSGSSCLPNYLVSTSNNLEVVDCNQKPIPLLAGVTAITLGGCDTGSTNVKTKEFDTLVCC